MSARFWFTVDKTSGPGKMRLKINSHSCYNVILVQHISKMGFPQALMPVSIKLTHPKGLYFKMKCKSHRFHIGLQLGQHPVYLG